MDTFVQVDGVFSGDDFVSDVFLFTFTLLLGHPVILIYLLLVNRTTTI